MRIEFATTGNGTNVQVSLIDEKAPGWGIVDRFYTSTHTFPFCMVPGSPQCDYRQTFFDLEAVMEPPIISGQFAAYHPYWAEREEKRKRRAQI